MISDILLLVAVFENFRKTCLQYYKLPRCHYFKRPGLSWDAMLKMTDIKLELMVVIDMYQFIEKSMRGGISYIANRVASFAPSLRSGANDATRAANKQYALQMSCYCPILRLQRDA